MNPLELAVRKSMAKLVTAFGQKVDDADETVFVYLEALRDLEPLDIEGGTARAIRAERYFPRPSILRSFALEERTARTVMVRPLIHTGEDILCSQCGSTSVWLRFVDVRGGIERIEVSHRHGCPLRRTDQPGVSLAA
jgi:hypothetical protein